MIPIRNALQAVREALEKLSKSPAWISASDPDSPEPTFRLDIDKPEFHVPCDPPYQETQKLSPLANHLFCQLEKAGFNPKVCPKDGRFVAIALDNPAYLRKQIVPLSEAMNAAVEEVLKRTAAPPNRDIPATDNGESMGCEGSERTAVRLEQADELAQLVGQVRRRFNALRLEVDSSIVDDIENAFNDLIASIIQPPKREAAQPGEESLLDLMLETYRDTCGYPKPSRGGMDAVLRVLRPYLRKPERESGWLSMESAPRDIGEQIMVTDGEHVVPAEWTGDEFYYHNITCHAMFDWFEPTGWQPLPVPPDIARKS